MKALVRHTQQRLIIETFQSSRIDYAGAYLHLYASYNSWYRYATGHSLDNVALSAMKQRYELWRDCFDGNSLQLLRSPMRRIYVLTQHRPLLTSSGVPLYLEDDTDWKHLIDFWYAVRCDVAHATPARLHGYHEQYIRLAYESLLVYMTEIVSRLQVQSQASMVGSLSERSAFTRLPESHLVDMVSHHRFKSADISLRSA